MPSLESIKSFESVPLHRAAMPRPGEAPSLESNRTSRNNEEVWSVDIPPIENLRANEAFLQEAKRYNKLQKNYQTVSAKYEVVSRSRRLRYQAQNYYNQLLQIRNEMQNILNAFRMTNSQIKTRYKNMVKNFTFSNNPRYRNLRAALLNLHPEVSNPTIEQMDVIVRGNIPIPNNRPENTPDILAKKARIRSALAAITSRGGKRKYQYKTRRRIGGQQATPYDAQAQSLIANLLETRVPQGYYTYMVWDEIPNPNLAPGYLHAFIKNIPVGTDGKIQLANGNTVVEYAPPTPPAGSGTHTYHFALYKQSSQGLATNARNTRRAKYNRTARVRNLGLEFVAHRDFTITA